MGFYVALIVSGGNRFDFRVDVDHILEFFFFRLIQIFPVFALFFKTEKKNADCPPCTFSSTEITPEQ